MLLYHVEYLPSVILLESVYGDVCMCGESYLGR